MERREGGRDGEKEGEREGRFRGGKRERRRRRKERVVRERERMGRMGGGGGMVGRKEKEHWRTEKAKRNAVVCSTVHQPLYIHVEDSTWSSISRRSTACGEEVLWVLKHS